MWGIGENAVYLQLQCTVKVTEVNKPDSQPGENYHNLIFVITSNLSGEPDE
jgi:hypothetical protein